MLHLISTSNRKKAAQAELKRNLKDAFSHKEKRTLGFQGDTRGELIYYTRENELYAVFDYAENEKGERRYWNAFGIYQSGNTQLPIVVEINIPLKNNDRRVAGFFAEDRITGDIFLMHDGGIGGSQHGIGKNSFLISSKPELVQVDEDGREDRIGFIVAQLGKKNVAERIWAFVKLVSRYKAKAKTGELETKEFKEQVEIFPKYKKEFVGKVYSSRKSEYEYHTYHGDIVDKLHEERHKHSAPDEIVSNDCLIDLFVRKNGVLTEVYEVKTSVGRQMLYTAIGQVLTHATKGNQQKVKKIIVIPDKSSIPEDVKKAMENLGIEVRRFKIEKGGIELN